MLIAVSANGIAAVLIIVGVIGLLVSAAVAAGGRRLVGGRSAVLSLAVVMVGVVVITAQ